MARVTGSYGGQVSVLHGSSLHNTSLPAPSFSFQGHHDVVSQGLPGEAPREEGRSSELDGPSVQGPHGGMEQRRHAARLRLPGQDRAGVGAADGHQVRQPHQPPAVWAHRPRRPALLGPHQPEPARVGLVGQDGAALGRAEQQQPLHRHDQHHRENINISWCPDGNYIAVGNKDDIITVIDARKFKVQPPPPPPAPLLPKWAAEFADLFCRFVGVSGILGHLMRRGGGGVHSLLRAPPRRGGPYRSVAGQQTP